MNRDREREGAWQVIAGDHQGSFELRHWLTAIEVLVTYNWTQQRRQKQRPIDWGLQNGDEDLSLESLESECLADDDDNCALIIASCAAQLQQFAQFSLSLPPPVSLFLWIKDVCQRHFWAGVNWIPVQVRWWWMGSRLWLHTGLTTSFSTVLLSHSLQPYLSLSLSDFAHLIYRAGKLKLRTLLLWTMNCRNATEESQSQSQSELELEL